MTTANPPFTPRRAASCASSSKVEAAVAARRCETPIGKCYLVYSRFENAGGNVLALGDQLRRRLSEQPRGVAPRPAGMRATAEAGAVCVAGDEIDAVDRDGEQGRDDLRKAGSRDPGRLPDRRCRTWRQPRFRRAS